MPSLTGPSKACPTCGRLVAADRLLCQYCLTNLSAVEILTAEEDARIRALPAAPRRLGWPRFRYIVLVVFLGLGAWGGIRWYQATRPAPPVPVASSASRASQSGAAHWDAPSGDATATRASAGTPWQAPVAWQHRSTVALLHGIVADEARIYFAREDNRVVAVHQADGSEAWQFEAPIPIGAAPTLAGDRLFLPLRNGHVIALDARSGEMIWEHEAAPGRMLFAPLVIRDGTVFAYTSGAVFAWDAETGDILWHSTTLSEWALVAPAISDHWVVIAGYNRVEVFDRKTGVRTYQYAHRAAAGVILWDNRVYTDSPNFATAVDPASRLPWWEWSRPVLNQLWIMNAAPAPPPPPALWIASHPVARGATITVEAFAPVLAASTLVSSRNDGTVIGIDSSTGAKRWEAKTPGLSGSPVASGGSIVLPTREAIVSLDAATGAAGPKRALPALPGIGKIALAPTAKALYVLDTAGMVTALREP